MHGVEPAAEIARSPAAWERLAKDWLVEVIERTPLADVEGLPLTWIAHEAPPLIAEILGQLSDPGTSRDLTLTPAARERAASLAAGRGVDAATRLPRELAALQALLIDALGREIPERDRGDFARAVGRLAEVFGAVQSAALESLAVARSGEAARDPDTGLPGPAELNEWIRILISEHRRTQVPFSLVHIDVDGIEQIATASGADAAWRVTASVAAVVGGQLAGRERVFRVSEAQFVVLAPGHEARDMVDLSTRLAGVVEDSQVEDGPRLALVAGIASCPQHGDSAEHLIDAAEEAAWAARAAGEVVSIAREASVQDS